MVAFCQGERSSTLIPVVAQPEPADFAANVRSPGQAFLSTLPRPTRRQFKNHDYWRRELTNLKTAYTSVCAYSSFWIPGNCSVDHFLPKSVRPDLAYEWSNYRLAHDKINSNKGDSTEVLDPFLIQVGWFVVDIATLWVNPEASLEQNLRTSIQKTIEILRLNDEQWVRMRFEIYTKYMDGTLSLIDLQTNYPFIAAELQRQNIQP